MGRCLKYKSDLNATIDSRLSYLVGVGCEKQEHQKGQAAAHFHLQMRKSVQLEANGRDFILLSS
jgi:hypothetical protein